jgi:hypothetical protein
MRLIELHDVNNPSRVVPFDVDDFSSAIPMNQGCAVIRKDSDIITYVHESAEEVMLLVEGAQ